MNNLTFLPKFVVTFYNMSQKEINNFLKLLEKEKKAAAKHTKAEAEAFLKRVGILTKKGKVAFPYKDIFIPKEQA